jgi:hypothetical protein
LTWQLPATVAAALPLLAANAKPDLSTTWADLSGITASRTEAARAATATTYAVCWPGHLSARVSDGQLIELDPSPACDPATMAAYLWGPLAVVALAQRQHWALHASALATSSGAWLLCGNSGSGKSTLTAALLLAGYSLISDDVAAISLDTGHPWCQPGPGRIKLWPDSCALLAIDAPDLVHRAFNKRSWPCAHHPQAEPIRGIIVLTAGPQPGLSELPPQSALHALLAHHAAAEVLTNLDRSAELAWAAAIVDTVPVYRLTLPPCAERDPGTSVAAVRPLLDGGV